MLAGGFVGLKPEVENASASSTKMVGVIFHSKILRGGKK